MTAAVLFSGIWVLLGACIAVGMWIYTKSVVPTLDAHGRPASYSMTPRGQAKQVEEYRRICVEHGHSLTKYRVFVTCRRVSVVLLVGWVVLALAMVVQRQ